MFRPIHAAICAAFTCTAAAAAPNIQIQHRVAPLSQSEAVNNEMTPGQSATLNQPLGITIDSVGNLYVANLNTGITIYNPKLVLTGTINASLPTAVGVNSTDTRIAVTSGATYAITIFDQNHNQVSTITDSTLRYPLGMFIDHNDAIWLLDNSGTVHAYLDNGTPAGSIYTGGTAIGPFLANWSTWGSPYPDTAFPYANYYGNAGEALHNGPGIGGGYLNDFSVSAAAEDSQHNQYVTDTTHNAITEQFYPGGTVGVIIGLPGVPYGIAVDAVRGRIYVSLPQSNIINIYSLKTHKLMKTLR